MLMLFIILFVHLGFVGSMNNNVCMQTEELSCFQLRGLKRVAKQGASVFICRDLQAICLGTTGSQAEMKKTSLSVSLQRHFILSQTKHSAPNFSF